jgi:uncharacterized membrane protein YgcG
VPYLVGGFGLLATLAYYLVAWLRVGRDLPAGPIVPLFTPPDGLSAAAMRYIVELGGMDKRIFSAALVQLGIKGKLRLVEGLGSTTIEQRPGGAVDLGPGEAKMLARLFRDSATISVTNKNHDAFGKAWDFLKAGLRANYEGKLFLRNLRWSWLGFACIGSAIWLTTSVVVLLRMPTKMQYIWFAYGLAVATTITINTLVVKARLRATPTVLNGFFRRFFFGLLTLVLFFGTFVLIVQIGGLLFFEFFIFTMHHNDIGDLRPPVFAPLLALPVAITSFWWMKAPTREGRAVLDRIAGFKQYLSIAEEDRLERLHPPEKTPELFERYLPYAIALGVENKWADRFTAVLAAAAAAATGQASMDWYSGHSHPWSDAGRFVDNVGSSLASSLASASTSPSSDSSGGGSSGGGSSGGGGGGGGGGGW